MSSLLSDIASFGDGRDVLGRLCECHGGGSDSPWHDALADDPCPATCARAPAARINHILGSWSVWLIMTLGGHFMAWNRSLSLFFSSWPAGGRHPRSLFSLSLQQTARKKMWYTSHGKVSEWVTPSLSAPTALTLWTLSARSRDFLPYIIDSLSGWRPD